MEQKHDLDDLIKNIVKEEGLERPSVNFTNNVMDAVSKAKSVSSVYKPLIPKYVLFGIGAVVILSMIFLSVNGYISNNNSPTYLYKIINTIKIPKLNLQIPVIFSYILGSTLLMVMLQAFILGGLFKKMTR